FVDTAGLRDTTDTVEALGIERTYIKISQALIVLMLLDARETVEVLLKDVQAVYQSLRENQRMIILINKADLVDHDHLISAQDALNHRYSNCKTIQLSAKLGINIETLNDELVAEYGPSLTNSDAVVITNARHYESLLKAKENLERVSKALENNLPTDLLAMDIRQVLHFIGEITGEITTEEILGSIFSKFCIGK
ncbi:MAG: tRNA uridine-5-carboxymethylaminomethyl(34) synthesis GTPase MnmE, partial [Bacteroidetes bacterium HGW-Bacteroidetes-15]